MCMRPNVVLIILDSVRKDYFDEYATRLRNRSDVSYEACRAASSWSVPSHASILTGTLPSDHCVNSVLDSYHDLELSDTFLDDLSDYRNLGVSTNVFAGTVYGFDHLFDSFTSVPRQAMFPEGLDLDYFERTTDVEGIRKYWEYIRQSLAADHSLYSLLNGLMTKLNTATSERLPVTRLSDYGTKAAIRECKRMIGAGPEPFFMFLNLMEAHPPYTNARGYDGSLHSVPNDWSSNDTDIWEINNAASIDDYETYLQNYRQIYATAIEYLDRKLDQFINAVEDATDRETVFIVTSDHGENLGQEPDQSLVGHVGSLTDALLHVPFEVINAPNDDNQMVREHTTHLELSEYIPELTQGNIRDIARETVPAERIGLGLSRSPDNYGYWNRIIRSCYRKKTKFQWDSLGNTIEYRIEANRPSYQADVRTQTEIPGWAKSAFDIPISECEVDSPSERDLGEAVDAETRSQLENLGYM